MLTSGTVRNYAWRREPELPGLVFIVWGRYMGGPRPIEVTLRPCGTMRYSTDTGRAIPLYVVRELEASLC